MFLSGDPGGREVIWCSTSIKCHKLLSAKSIFFGRLGGNGVQ